MRPPAGAGLGDEDEGEGSGGEGHDARSSRSTVSEYMSTGRVKGAVIDPDDDPNLMRPVSPEEELRSKDVERVAKGEAPHH